MNIVLTVVILLVMFALGYWVWDWREVFKPWTQDELNVLKLMTGFCDTENELKASLSIITRYEWRKEHNMLDRSDVANIMWIANNFGNHYKNGEYFKLDDDGIPIFAKEPYREFVKTSQGAYLIKQARSIAEEYEEEDE